MLVLTTGSKAIENASRRNISAVTFTADGHVFSGDEGGEIRRWRTENAQQIGSTMKARGSVESIALSNDGLWLVSGDDGRKAIVWNAHTHQKVLEVAEHKHFVYTVDISGESTRFASGSCDKTARIFDITTGIRLVPPLRHDHAVVGLRFSPGDGDQLATAMYDACVRVYDSHTGDILFVIPVQVLHTPTTPLVWSSNGKELFIVSPGKITYFNISTSSSSEWSTHSNSTRASIIINQRFIACSAGSSVSFWDVDSREQIGLVIKHLQDVLCITNSPTERLLACGHGNKISVYDLGAIIPDLHLRPTVSRPSPTPPLSQPPRLPPVNKSCASSGPIGDGAEALCSIPVPHKPTIAVDLLVKRSAARAASRLWEESLRDANEAIQANASCHYAHERKYLALHGMGRYDDAIAAFDTMLSVIERSEDLEIRQLHGKHVSTSQKQKAIEDTVRHTFKNGPLVFIDATTGILCDRYVLPELFKADPTFKELVSSMTTEIDKERIRKAVNKYFGYVMLSHVWGNGKEEEKPNEPSFKVVKDSESVYRLPNTPMNNKLRSFCTKATELGYRWAWSDTCCIDKSDDAILNRSLRSMYKWYEGSDATLVFLGDVSSDVGELLHSLWMTRAWTLQEALAPNCILFYDQDWKLYRGMDSDNHKKPGVVLQELAKATGVPSETLVSFHPDSLGVREKLCLASERNATVEEDAAYSLIGIFKSDIIPRYGEGEDALGHLLEGIVAHLGDTTVLAWTGNRSSYHSCLPSNLSVYSRTPHTPPTLDVDEMRSQVIKLSNALSRDDAMNIYHQIVRLPPPRFVNRRLQLPCIVFHIKSLSLKDWENRLNHYSVKGSRLNVVEFTTADRLPTAEHWRLALVHPWINHIRGSHPHNAVRVDESDSDSDTEAALNPDEDTVRDEEPAAVPPSGILRGAPLNDHALALQMIVRLRQPFSALLLLRQPGGEYTRVAAENEIVVQISAGHVRPKDIHADVLDIL